MCVPIDSIGRNDNRWEQLLLYRHGFTCHDPLRNVHALLWCIREKRLDDARLLMLSGADPFVPLLFQIDDSVCPSPPAARDGPAGAIAPRHSQPRINLKPLFMERARQLKTKDNDKRKYWRYNDNEAWPFAQFQSHRMLATFSALSLAVYMQLYDVVEWMLRKEQHGLWSVSSSCTLRERNVSDVAVMSVDAHRWSAEQGKSDGDFPEVVLLMRGDYSYPHSPANKDYHELC